MRYSVFESNDGSQTALVRVSGTTPVPQDLRGQYMQTAFVIESDTSDDALSLYEEWKRKRFFCDHCGRSHMPTPCCGEQECTETWSCSRCGRLCCENCGVGGFCSDCDVDNMVDEDEGDEDDFD